MKEKEVVIIELDREAANTLYFFLTDMVAMKKSGLGEDHAKDIWRVIQALEKVDRILDEDAAEEE